MTGMRLLARLRFLRGTAFDPFGLSRDRRSERQLIREYEQLLQDLHAVATRDNLGTIIALAALPETVRGYGHVKQAAIQRMQARRNALLETLKKPARPTSPGAKGKDRFAVLPLPQ